MNNSVTVYLTVFLLVAVVSAVIVFRSARRAADSFIPRARLGAQFRADLVERLREYARRLGVPVLVCSAESLRDWRTNRSSLGRAIRWRSGRWEIRIDESCAGDPLVLAHEIGHVVSWRVSGTTSEVEADFEAERVIRSVLTPAEWRVAGPWVSEAFRSREAVRGAEEAERRARDLDRRFGRTTA